MGFSGDHDLLWDDFPCENYTDSKLFVGFLREEQVDVTTGSDCSKFLKLFHIPNFSKSLTLDNEPQPNHIECETLGPTNQPAKVSL